MTPQTLYNSRMTAEFIADTNNSYDDDWSYVVVTFGTRFAVAVYEARTANLIGYL